MEPNSTSTLSGVSSHLCNCIGCCKACGQCRTAPTHSTTCVDIKRLNDERSEILNRAVAFIAPEPPKELFVVCLYDTLTKKYQRESLPMSANDARYLWNIKTANGTKRVYYSGDKSYYMVVPESEVE